MTDEEDVGDSACRQCREGRHVVCNKFYCCCLVCFPKPPAKSLGQDIAELGTEPWSPAGLERLAQAVTEREIPHWLRVR